MDTRRTNKRRSERDRRAADDRQQEGDGGSYARHHRCPTIGGIKSAKERRLSRAARGGAESDEVERNRGAKEADTIHNGLGEPAPRSNATPTGITDVHNRR